MDFFALAVAMTTLAANLTDVTSRVLEARWPRRASARRQPSRPAGVLADPGPVRRNDSDDEGA